MSNLLETLHTPATLKGWPLSRLHALAEEIRGRIIETVSVNGGHRGKVRVYRTTSSDETT